MLVYATGSDHSLRHPAELLIRAIANGEVQATTTVEVIQEFAHVRSRRSPRPVAVRQARSYAEGLAPLAATSAPDLDAGLALYEHATSLGSFDAVLAAVARDRGANLVSADRGFATAPGLDFLPLDGPELTSLLSRSG